MSIDLNHYYSGTSGLLLPVPNKLHYPKEFQNASRLCYYGSLMNSIEVNSSFYRIPQVATVKRWALDVPREFRFTFKLFREVTHSKDLIFDPGLIGRFFAAISNVGDKKGCVLVQFPPSLRISQFPRLRYFMSSLRDHDPEMEWNIALEFRHKSLYADEVLELLEALGMGMVIHDKAPGASPIRDSRLDFVYLRFHGPDGNYKGSYQADVLHEYASYVSGWLSEGKKVFVYFNNTMGQPHANLNTLRQLLKDVY